MKKFKHASDEYDYLFVSVKNTQLNRIMMCYNALGWQVVKKVDDRKYFDRKYFTLRRLHNVKNKDRLQYLQVRIETLINQISYRSFRKHFASGALSTMLITLASLFTVGSVLSFIFLPQSVKILCGVVAAVLAVASALTLIYPATIMRSKEEESVNSSIGADIKQLEIIMEEVRSLSPNNKEGGQG